MPNIPISDKEKKAWDFAKEKHEGQVRKFINKSYFDAHIQKVNRIVKKYTTDEDILISSLLHDTIEDCYDNKWVGYKDIKALFGKKVAEIVIELTSDGDEIDHRYDGSKTDYLIHKMINMSADALIIKLADRLQNISDAFTTSEKFRNKYFQETSEIVEAIESGRELNNIHQKLLADIKSKLDNISSIFKTKRYIKTYEFFSFGKKPKTWKQKFEEIYNFYLKNKDKEDILPHLLPHADVKDDSFSVSLGLKNHIVVYGNTTGNHNMEVVDFDEVDYSNPKSDKGVYPISKDEYDKYLSKCQEISDWLDDLSDKRKGKSHSTIGVDGFYLDFNEGDLALDELNDKLNSQLPIGKELEFELSYHVWVSESKNTLIIEKRNLKIKDVKIGFGGNRFYAEVFTIDPFGKNAKMWIESDTSSEYDDLELLKWPYRNVKLIRMCSIKPEMSRREEREEQKNRKYPYAFSYYITPSKYESIKFIKNITELLSELNIKNK